MTPPTDYTYPKIRLQTGLILLYLSISKLFNKKVLISHFGTFHGNDVVKFKTRKKNDDFLALLILI